MNALLQFLAPVRGEVDFVVFSDIRFPLGDFQDAGRVNSRAITTCING